MRKGVNVLDSTILVIPLDVIPLSVRGALLRLIERQVRLVTFGSELREVRPVLGMVGNGLEVREIPDDDNRVRFEVLHKAERCPPNLLFLPRRMGVRNHGNAPDFVTAFPISKVIFIKERTRGRVVLEFFRKIREDFPVTVFCLKALIFWYLLDAVLRLLQRLRVI